MGVRYCYSWRKYYFLGKKCFATDAFNSEFYNPLLAARKVYTSFFSHNFPLD